MFIAKRTERDGILIAYEGEAMSEQEAVRRGLLKDEPAKAEPKKAPAKKAPAKKTTARKAPAKKAAPKKAKED